MVLRTPEADSQTVVLNLRLVTERRDGEECISKQELEQETTKGTHNKRQLTNASQQCYTSHKWQSPNQAAVQASN